MTEILAEGVPSRRVHRVEAHAGTMDLLDECVAQIGGMPEGPVFITGLEAAIPEPATSALVASLNLRRPEWPEKLPVPVVFWVNEHLAGALPREAPDFFDWRADSVFFPESPVDDLRAFSARSWFVGPDPRLTAAEREARIIELQSRIVGNGDDEKPEVQKAVLGWLDEVADHLTLLGRYDEALKLRERARELAERLGLEEPRIVALGKIAEILESQGRLKEALEFRRQEISFYEAAGAERNLAVAWASLANILINLEQADEALKILASSRVLPVLDRLGESQQKAIVLAQMAHIYQARGEFDRALTILRSEVLPVFEERGDFLSRAVTFGRIANVLRKMGRLEEALTLHHGELAIYEKIGDARKAAFALGKIADVHGASGDLDRAIELCEQQVLPAIEALGLKPDLAYARVSLAGHLASRGHRGDQEKSLQLLDLAREAFKELGHPIAESLSEFIAVASHPTDRPTHPSNAPNVNSAS